MPSSRGEVTIDEYLRKRLMPVEGAIPQLPGIEMYGNSIPAGTVGGDIFEYINFQQRYDIDARIERAYRLSREYLEPLKPGSPLCNAVDEHVRWMRSRVGFTTELEAGYRSAKSSEQLEIAENLQQLYSTAGVLLVDAQGHGIISAKIASTVHDVFHAFMLSELDEFGRTTTGLFEKINLRLAQSVTARNALGRNANDNAREVATMLYGEIRPSGSFRFVNFGHPPPLVYSAEYRRFMKIDEERMVQFLALGLQIPEDDPDRRRYYSMRPRNARANSNDVAEITLMMPGDILVLHTDGVYDGFDGETLARLEAVMRDQFWRSAKEICDALLQEAVRYDEVLRANGETDVIDDKTLVVIKRC